MIDRKVDKLKLVCDYLQDVSECFNEYQEKLFELTLEESDDESSSTSSKEQSSSSDSDSSDQQDDNVLNLAKSNT